MIVDSGMSAYLSGLESLQLGRLLDQMAALGPLVLLARGPSVPSGEGLPGSVRMVDLSAKRRIVYAATDVLSERVRWVARPQDCWPSRPN